MLSNFLAVFGAILVSFILGLVVVLFLAGGTTLTYLKVKWGRGTKIFMWVDTPTGRVAKVGTIEGEITEGVVSWNYRKEKKLTAIKKENIGDYLKVKYMSVNVDDPEVAYDLTVLGERPARSIDQPTFNNILKRALTRPSLDDDVAKKMRLVIIMIAVVGVAVLFVIFKVVNLENMIKTLGVL